MEDDRFMGPYEFRGRGVPPWYFVLYLFLLALVLGVLVLRLP